MEGDDTQCHTAPLQNDSFINQLAGAAADFAASRSCQTNQLFFLPGTRPRLEGFLHNTLLLLPLNPFVCRCAAPVMLRFLPTCSLGGNGCIVWSRSASPRRIAAICRQRGLCVSLPEMWRSQEKQEREKKKKKKEKQALFHSLLYRCLHKFVCGLISHSTDICYLLGRSPPAPAMGPRGAVPR